MFSYSNIFIESLLFNVIDKHNIWKSNPNFTIYENIEDHKNGKKIRLFDYAYPKYKNKRLYFHSKYKPSKKEDWQSLYKDIHHSFKEEGACVYCYTYQPKGDKRINGRFIFKCFRGRKYSDGLSKAKKEFLDVHLKQNKFVLKDPSIDDTKVINEKYYDDDVKIETMCQNRNNNRVGDGPSGLSNLSKRSSTCRPIEHNECCRFNFTIFSDKEHD